MNYTIAYLLLVLFYSLLIWKSGKTYPILYLFLFTFFLQYIFSTYLVYAQYKELRTQMPIKESDFFEYAIPAISSLFLGVFLFNKDVDIKEKLQDIDPSSAIRLGYLLLAISYGVDLMRFAELPFFNSLLSFTSYIKYLAAFCFLFSKSRFLYFVSVMVYFQLLLSVVVSGVFIDFIAWGTFLFFIISLRFKLNIIARGLLFLSAIPILVTIQSVKHEYRKATWNKVEGSLALFSEMIEKNNENDKPEASYTESKGMIRTIGRLSQGWHLGLTLRHVPTKVAFSNGEEMISDMVASVIPRAFFADKKIVHTKEKFYMYTGHKLRGNTSMSIGLLGDFYINFGRTGSFIMLFTFGVIIALLVRAFFTRYVVKDPINIIWLPYLLNYLILADNDFYIFFNCALKGFLIFLIINYIRIQFLEPKRNPVGPYKS